ncbi:MAG TPA: RecQ family ATP-dependent DNA helicase [Chroococcales cyanobacterium]
MKTGYEILKKHWGYESLLPNQKEAVEAVLKHRDCLVVLPTGGGKSLCYQLPALLLEGMAIVVSPLLSLIKDQVDALRANGISAAALNSMLSYEEKKELKRAILRGQIKILYLAPESLLTREGETNEGLFDLLEAGKPSFFAIDEAHCISQWGHEFRPAYRVLGKIREKFPSLSIHAFTATATEEVRLDIVRSLNFKNGLTLIGHFDRPNLVYRTAYRKDMLAQVREVLDRHRGEAGIVYCIRKADVDSLCEKLRLLGYQVLPYHAGLSDEERKKNQESFIKEEVDIVVATVAFGMGIDRSNVRFVVHAGMPKALENYQQEAGRAGRDGLPAECFLLYSGADAMQWRRIQGEPQNEQEKSALSRIGEMARYCQHRGCRHRFLLEYFGQTLEKENCGACDFCLDEQAVHPRSPEISRLILSGALCLKERYGASHLVEVLKGSRSAKVLANHHESLTAHGTLKEFASTDIRQWVEEIIEQEFLERWGEFNVLFLTEKGKLFLDGQGKILLGLPQGKKEKKESRSIDRENEGDSEKIEKVFMELRELRKKIAQERGVPPYVILHDKTLLEIARRLPDCKEELRSIKGLGEVKIEQFGDRLLELVGRHLEQKKEKKLSLASPKNKEAKGNTVQVTRAFFQDGLSAEEIAKKRGLATSTINGHLVSLLEEGEIPLDKVLSPEKVAEIKEAVAEIGREAGAALLKVILPESTGYEDIRLALAGLPPCPPLGGKRAERMREMVQAALERSEMDLERVVEATIDQEVKIRCLGAFALGRIATRSAEMALLDLLERESHPLVRQRADEALKAVYRALENKEITA